MTPDIKSTEVNTANTGAIDLTTVALPVTRAELSDNPFITRLQSFLKETDLPHPHQGEIAAIKNELFGATASGIAVMFKYFNEYLNDSGPALGLVTENSDGQELIWANPEVVDRNLIAAGNPVAAAKSIIEFSKPIWDRSIRDGLEDGKRHQAEWIKTLAQHKFAEYDMTMHFSRGAGTGRSFFWMYMAALTQVCLREFGSHNLTNQVLIEIANNSKKIISTFAMLNMRHFILAEKQLSMDQQPHVINPDLLELVNIKGKLLVIPNPGLIEQLKATDQQLKSSAQFRASQARLMAQPRTGCPAHHAKLPDTQSTVLIEHLNYQLTVAERHYFPAVIKQSTSHH